MDITSKGRTSLGEKLMAKGESIFRKGYRRVLGGEREASIVESVGKRSLGA